MTKIHPTFLPRPRALGLTVAAVALAADQVHKYWMLNVLGIGDRQPIRLSPFLDVVLSWNRGISYSLFAAENNVARLLLLAIQLAIISAVTLWLWRARTRFVAIALGLIIGGALGNAADRLFRGAVADFFFFHTPFPVGPLANYVFNLADAAITVGVALLLIESLVAPSGRQS